jgi:chromosome segregation ATPase
MPSNWGRNSPSFLIALAALVIGLGGYGIWTLVRPNAHARSEHLVRDFSHVASREVNEFRRSLRDLTDHYKKGADLDKAIAAIDKQVEEAVDRVRDRADEARDELTELDLAISTQRNRLKRIDTREEEATDMITGMAEDAKTRLRGDS